MNQGIFKVIFNRTLNRFVVVSELAKAAGKGSERAVASSGQFLQKICKIRPLVFGLMHALGWVSMPLSLTLLPSLAVAETLIIKADPTAPKAQQPIILQTANGLPQVNIQTPNDKGLSHNKYAKFDVAEKGAILNNSRKAVQTQQGGWVQGNPYLARGEAKVILNEVNSTDPSVLKGYVEVAGQKAEVIIANPAGLHCDGCGVINAARSTFTTGKPQVVNGQLESLVVEKGNVRVSGKGLDNSRVDYSEIIAREAQVNAGIWAGKEMAVVTGKNTVKRTDKRSDSGESLQIIHTNQPLAGEPTPEFALDVGELGGMYAGKIHLIGTENGVGVRNAGHIGASSDSLKIDSQGRILNLGAMNAEKDVVLGSPQEVENQGKIENRTGNIKLESGRAVRNEGSVVARGGKAVIKAEALNNQNGEISTKSDLQIELTNGELNNAQGTLFSGNNSRIEVAHTVINTEQGKIQSLGNLTVNATSVDNRGGFIQTLHNSVLNGTEILNDRVADNGSLIESGSRLNITTSKLTNRETMASEPQPTQGIIAANFELNGAKEVDNQKGGIYSTQSGKLSISNDFNNRHGEILSGGNLSLLGGETLNTDNFEGKLQANNQLIVRTERLSGDGYIEAGDIQLGLVADFDIQQDINAKRNLLIDTQGLITNRKKLAAADRLQLSAGSITNLAEGRISSAHTRLEAKGVIHNEGLINSFSDEMGGQAKTVLKAQKIENVGSGRIYGDNVALGANTILNQDKAGKSATIAARKRLDLAATEIINETQHYDETRKGSSTIYSDGDIVFGRELNQQDLAEGQAEILRNKSSTIEALRNIALNVAQTFNTNEHFSTVMKEYPEEGSKEHQEYVLINLSNGDLNTGFKAKVDRFYRRGLPGKNKQRGYDLLWKTDLDRKLSNDELEGYIPTANQPICSAADSTLCYYNPNTVYGSDYGIWKRFGIKVPNDMPEITLPEVLKEPKKPARPSNRQLQNAAVKARYENELAQYEQAFSAYKQSIEAYNLVLKPYLDWMETHKQEFKTLNEAITNNNRHYTGDNRRRWMLYANETKVIKETVKTSLPAQILAGGDITLGGNALLNDKSRILAGGALNTQNTTIQVENKDKAGEKQTIFNGRYEYVNPRWRGNSKGWRHYNQGGQTQRVETTSFDMNLYSTLGNQSISRVTPTISTEANGVSSGNIEIRTSGVDIRLPNQGMYKINPEASSHFLIETDPAFTDHKRWLSSDYMLAALRTDHDLVHKRLGDGFYEQRLIREQISQLTGRAFLGNYTDFESQYKALMDAGVTVAQQFNLQIGVALTPAQVAQLTSDIVWFETQSVTLADGKVVQVLVPKIYAVARKGDLDGTGALISANSIDLKTKELENSGTVAGRTLTRLNAESLKNSGRLSSGSLEVTVLGDAENAGGIIEADSSLTLDVKGDFTHRSTTQTSTVNLDGYSRTDTNLDRLALIHVKNANGTLSLNANNITVAGAEIRNDGNGDSNISAQNNLSFTSVSVGFDEKMGQGNHYRNEAVADVVVSRVQGNGNVTFSAKNIHSEGAELAAARQLAFDANQVVLDTAKRTSEYEEYHHNKKRNIVRSSSDESFTHTEKEQNKATVIAAENILIKTTGDTILRGTQALATQDITIDSDGEVLLDTASNSVETHAWNKHKHRGVASGKSGGVATVGVANNKAEGSSLNSSTTVLSTSLQALGNITVVSNNGNVTANAARIRGGGDVSVEGKNVQLNAVTETTTHESQYKESKKGAAFGFAYKPDQLFKDHYGEQAGQGSAAGIIGKIFTSIDAFSNAVKQTASQGAPQAKYQRKEHHESSVTEMAKTNSFHADGNLSIKATGGNVTSQGGQFSAKGNGSIVASNDVNLDVSINRQRHSSNDKTKGMERDMAKAGTSTAGIHSGKHTEGLERVEERGAMLSFGGESLIHAEQGSANIKGAQVISGGKNRIEAGKDVVISTAKTTTRQGVSDTMHTIGGVATSDTERFAGYHRTLGSQNGEEVIHTGSLITSLNDDVDIKAKGAFHQTSSQIVANNRVDVTGKSVTFDAVHNTTEYDTHQSDLKIGQFTRVISPIIDLIQSAEQLFDDKEASDRVKAARMLALAAQGYTLNNTVQNALDNSDKAVLFRVESGTGMSHGRNRTYGSTQDSVGNVVNGLHVNIVSTDDKIKATHTDFVSRDDKGNRRAGSSVSLDGKGGVELLAGESTYRHVGKNQHYGTEAGMAWSVGAKTGWSAYVKEGFGKGEQVSEGKTHQNSHIDTDHFTVKSDGDVLMKGATAKARVITTEIGGKLHIESQQDEHRSKQSQFGLNSKVEFGIGSSWEFSGNANAEGGNSHSKQVKEQSGLFAEERYSVEADSITLVGGAIASNTPGNSTIRTNNIAFSDIENSSDYSAASGSISGGYSQGGGVSGGTGVPMYDGGKDKTLTKATITNGTIILNKDTNPTETTAEALGINTDLSQANKQVAQPKDVGKLLEEQKAVQESAGHISKAAETYIARQQKEILKQEADTRKEAEEAAKVGDYQTAQRKQREADALEKEAKRWEIGGDKKRQVTAITTAINFALAGKPAEAIAAGAASPYVNEVIKKLTDSEELKSLNIPAHILWGAAESYLTGGSAETGAIAAGVGEVGAIALSHLLYGKAPSELNSQEKSNLLNSIKLLSGAAVAVQGTANGNSIAETTANAGQGMTVAENAVENNALNAAQSVEYLKELSEAIAQGKPTDEIHEKYERISLEEFQKDMVACQSGDILCYVGTLAAMKDGVASAEAFKNFYDLPPAVRQEAVDWVAEQAAKHSIEFTEASPRVIQVLLTVMEVAQEMNEAKNAGRGFSGAKAQAVFANKVRKGSEHRGSPIPYPENVTVKINGQNISLVYRSNAKHTAGQSGKRAGEQAGIEPRNSKDIFANSIPTKSNPDRRFSKDDNGVIHEFKSTGDGTWHWAKSSHDERSPLVKQDVPQDILDAFGIKAKGTKLK